MRYMYPSILARLFCLMVFVAQASIEPMPHWKPIIPNAIPDQFIPTSQHTLKGMLEGRIRINLEKRLLQIDSSVMLSGFRKRPGSQVWIGEHVGKFLYSSAYTYRYTRDERLKRLTDELVKKYLSYQLPNGYLGTYLPPYYWTEWDVWAHKYAIIGLLSHYSNTGDAQAIQAAKRAADLICSTFGDEPGQLDINTSGHHVGMASGSILEPMVDLYRYTGNSKYLQFAKYILKAWERPTGPKIMENMATYGTVDKVGNAKAYEMMSCFIGIAKYYRLTGEKPYFAMLEKAWKDIRLHRMYITGTASDHEHFQAEDHLMASNEDHMGEGCVTTTWIQWNHQMLLITGDVKYYEEIERAVYNHLLAAENPQTGCVSYYTALQGIKPHKCDQGFSCCLSSIPRGIALIPDMVYGRINGVFSLLHYESASIVDSTRTVSGKSVPLKLQVQSDMPFAGNTTLKLFLSESAEFDLALRVPAWCSKFTAVFGSYTVSGIPGSLVRLRNYWKNEDVIQVNFEMPVQVVAGGSSYPSYIAFKRGPQVLAADKLLNPWMQKFEDLDLKDTKEFKMLDAKNQLPENWYWKQAYALPVVVNGSKMPLILVPFAEAGQMGTDLSVWIKKSNQRFK